MSKITEIQRQIQEMIATYQSLKIVNSHLDETNKKLAEALIELDKLDLIVSKELKDVEKLEKAGIKSTFYNILGSKEDQLEKERQEYLEIALKFNEHKKMVELMEYEKELLARKTKDIKLVEKQLAQLKKLRANEILSSNNIKLKKEFTSIVQSIDHNRLFNKELKEAISTGERAVAHLSQVKSFLKQALNWGQWDMMGKRGNVSSHMKHNSVDKANRSLNKAQHELNLFSRELQDINEGHIEFKLKIEHFSRFTDYFFDNLITDWIIQQKIKNSKASVEATLDSVSRILASLQYEMEQNDEDFSKLSNAKEDLLTS